MNALAAATVIAFAATARAAGTAYVTNSCGYDVLLAAVPAAGNGYNEEDATLSAGQSWSMPYTQLNTGGWSIKLSGDPSFSNILQYEYTFLNDGTIWYDLSDVNGNPWDGNWMITSDNGDCSPRQAAYRYSTDDAYGEQSCPDDASITVTLCSGEDAPPAMAGSVQSLVPTAVVKAAVATPVAQATTFATQVSTPAPVVVGMSANGNAVEVAAKPKARRHSHHARHHA